MSAALAGKPLSESHRVAIGAAGRGRKQSEEHVRKRIAAATATKARNEALQQPASTGIAPDYDEIIFGQ